MNIESIVILSVTTLIAILVIYIMYKINQETINY